MNYGAVAGAGYCPKPDTSRKLPIDLGGKKHGREEQQAREPVQDAGH